MNRDKLRSVPPEGCSTECSFLGGVNRANNSLLGKVQALCGGANWSNKLENANINKIFIFPGFPPNLKNAHVHTDI